MFTVYSPSAGSPGGLILVSGTKNGLVKRLHVPRVTTEQAELEHLKSYLGELEHHSVLIIVSNLLGVSTLEVAEFVVDHFPQVFVRSVHVTHGLMARLNSGNMEEALLEYMVLEKENKFYD